jgi:hypothetical protein
VERLTDQAHELTLGPPRVYRPVCVRHPWGFIGGPIGYELADGDQADVGPIVIRARHERGFRGPV